MNLPQIGSLVVESGVRAINKSLSDVRSVLCIRITFHRRLGVENRVSRREKEKIFLELSSTGHE